MGSAPQTGYGQIIVNGSVSLNNPILGYAFDEFTPAAGTVFDIIQNNGGSAITGIFSGLPEGSVFKVGAIPPAGYLWVLSGHDVTLAVVDRPPTVTVITPSLVSGTLPAGATSLQIGFGQDVLGAGQAASYKLQSVGPDGLLGTADDVNVPLTVSSADGSAGTTATLMFSALADGLYHLIVKSTITDTNGSALDGNGDGTSGDNYVVDFVSTAASTEQFSSPGGTFNVLTSSLGAGELREMQRGLRRGVPPPSRRHRLRADRRTDIRKQSSGPDDRRADYCRIERFA